MTFCFGFCPANNEIEEQEMQVTMRIDNIYQKSSNFDLQANSMFYRQI